MLNAFKAASIFAVVNAAFVTTSLYLSSVYTQLHEQRAMSSFNQYCRRAAGQFATILVVEDEALVRIAAADVLIAAGYCVIEAADAAEAISALEAGHEIDLVFTDIRMPGSLDGIGLTEWVRERFPTVAVILNSANPPSRDLPGDTLFIAKPYLPQTVLFAIESRIGRRERDRAAENQTASGALP